MIPDDISVAAPQYAWRKSSYSGVNNGNCLEVADGFRDLVPVRDSKNPTGPVLAIPTGAWAAFVAHLAD